MKDELERIWKEAVLTCRHLRGQPEEKNDNLESGWPIFWVRLEPKIS
jgi:hypothetical protein